MNDTELLDGLLTQEEKTSLAFGAGYKSGQNGVSIIENPYDPTSENLLGYHKRCTVSSLSGQ